MQQSSIHNRFFLKENQKWERIPRWIGAKVYLNCLQQRHDFIGSFVSILKNLSHTSWVL